MWHNNVLSCTYCKRTVFYTGTTGDAVPVVKGWLRLSLRKIDTAHPDHLDYLPHRNYFSADVETIIPGRLYDADVEIWPTNVVVSQGDTLELQVSGHDTQGSGLFEHNHPKDRPESLLNGWNRVHVGPGCQSYLVLPVIPDE